MLFDRRSPRFLIVAAAGLATALLGGCVGQGQYDNLYETNRSLTEENSRLSRENDELRRSLDLLRGSNLGAEGSLGSLQRQNTELRAALDKALADLRDLQSRMGQLTFGPLDAETDAALRALADQYPDLIKYDSATGMLRFASDLTFDSGSDVVKEEAKRALAALGKILGSSAAQQYDVWVEGHTDSQRISANTSRRHPTNRHLSAHRAISVIDELIRQGVNANKMMAAGWGEFRPAVQNSASGNTPSNRRVEIYLAKARASGSAQAPAAEEAPATGTARPETGRTPTRQIDITK